MIVFDAITHGSSLKSLLIFLVSGVAAFLSSMSGEGASMITLPAFLSMGISFPVATTVQKVSATFWVVASAYNYLKGRKVNWFFLITFALIGLIGAYLGVLTVVSVNQRILKSVVGAFILGLALYIYLKKEAGLREQFIVSKPKEALSYVVALPMGFYEGLLGSGNGMAFAAVSFYTKGFDFIDALGYYFSIAFFWVGLAAVILIRKGYFTFHLVLPAVLGSLLGGFSGSKFARLKGNRFIKLIFVIIGGFLGLKLVLGL